MTTLNNNSYNSFFYTLGVSSTIGVVTALILNILWWQFGNSILDTSTIQSITFVLWPASLATMASPFTGYWTTQQLELIFFNAVLGEVYGVFVWLGLHKHKAFFIFLVLFPGWLAYVITR